MKVTLNWLKQYVEFNWSPEELTERLTMLGLEVEGVRKLSGEFDGIVVAQVVTRDKHPNADKLSVCRVNDGTGERQIVCGAQNFKAGDKIPLILPGASLPPKPGDKEPFTIKVGKIRSVESHGMMCSPDELGIDPEAIGHKKEDGLLILRDDAEVGQSFAQYLGRSGSDVVYDLEVTPNRPDLNSVIGIAREISAITGNPVRIPAATIPAAQIAGGIDELVSVKIEAADLCPRYTARVIKGVKVGPSPDWLRSVLEKVGLRSINNVVDVTNYVMLETGQPLHAFDYHLVAQGAGGKPAIVIRRASAGEKFVTLDGKEHALSADTLLIADETKGIALAGVMGGLNSEIKESTVDVLLESAYFNSTNIRRTSKTLGLRTDASYRFERGADIGATEFASRRAAQLIVETAGGTVAGGVVDAYPEVAKPKHISLRHQKVNDLLGLKLTNAEIDTMLGKLGFIQVSPGVFEIPSYRVDMKREADLIEEVARLFGVDKLPSIPPRGATGTNAFDTVHDQLAEARRILTGLGLSEAQGQTLISDASAKLAATETSIVALSNPLSSDMNVLRPSLLPGLMDSLRNNANHRVQDVSLFEIGRVFVDNNGEAKEERHVAIAITGRRSAGFWKGEERDAAADVFDLKGLVEEFIEQFGLRGIVYTRRPEPTGLFIESAVIALGGKQALGELGQVSPIVAKRQDIRGAVFLAELNLDLLLARRNPAKAFKALPMFPSSRRDVAMLIPEATTQDAVLQAVKQAKAANLESVELFDVFRGKNVPEGEKSMAYAFTYRAADRTLTDAEVNGVHEKLVAHLKQVLGATVRDS